MSAELGVCYYPEHWPQDMWESDAAQMYELGLSWVRIGEFAWSRIEPRPGEFNWEWLDQAIDILGGAGLKIILGTPTATPPRWMLDKHPDMLAVDANDNLRKFGSRRHYCFSHESYRDESVRITREMAKRYGKNPHIHAWQTDNEYGCHDTVISYSRAAEAAFRLWLKFKYQTIEPLNAAWGNVFWSMEYGDFDQIDLPNLTVTEPNPAHVMDFRRFSSDQVVRFNRAQCEVLREYTDAPLIHNYMGRITQFDHFAVGDDLDIASWDSYPLGFLEDRSDQGEDFKHAYMRQGDPDFQAFHHDVYRAVGQRRSKDGRWWVMEQQPGPVNWAPYNPAPLPGMVRLWTWEAIAHGAEVVSYFRWRQAPFGQEQMHSGLQRPDGAGAAGANEVKSMVPDLAKLSDQKITPSPVGLVFDYASAWAWETQQQCQDFDYFGLVYDVYRGLRRLGLSVDIIPPDTDSFGDKKLVCIPGLFAWTSELKRALQDFSGQVLIGPRSGSKTREFKIPDHMPPNIPGFECKIKSIETLRSGAKIALENGGHFHIWREFAQTEISPSEMTKDGQPAIISQGGMSYLAGWPDDEAMTRILSNIAMDAGIDIHIMTDGKRRRAFGDFTLHLDYGTGDVKVVNNKTHKSLLT